jgi:hypothetical protein
MPDNVRITTLSSGGTEFAADDVGGALHQRVKVSLGVDGSATDLAPGQKLSAASVPVVIASDQSAVAVSASALPLPAGAATEITLAAIAADVDRLPVLVSGRMPVDGSGVTQPVSGTVGVSGSVAVTGPLTDGQLRATAVAVDGSGVTQPVSGTITANAGTGTMAVSAAALPLPAGAATEATLAAMNAKIPAVGQAAMVASQPVAIASDQSAIPVSLPTMTASNYTFTGALAINTELLVIDCASVEAVSIQCISMGTSGVVTPEWSNNGTNYAAASIMTPGAVAAATFNAAGLWTTPVLGRWLRLRLSTAASGGTTTLSVQRLSQANALPTVSQPVAVAGTVPVSGTLTSAGTTTNTPVTPTTTFTNSAATNNAAFLKNSAGTIWSISAFNAGASPVYVKFYNRTTAPTVGTDVPVMVVAVPATETVMIGGGANGIRFATGIAIAIVTGAADTDNTAVAAAQVKVATSWT